VSRLEAGFVVKAPLHQLGGLGDNQELLALARDAIIVRDATGEIRFWNRGAEETYGWAAAEVVGRIERDILGRSSSLEEVVEQSLRSGEVWEGELTDIRKDGSEVVVASRQVLRQRSGGRPATILEINRNITDARRGLDLLKDKEERFRLMVESIQDYAILMLDADGIVLNWNSGAERIKGYRSEEICGEHFSRFYLANDVKAGKPAESLRAAASMGRVENDGWRVRKDGSRFWANVVITALRDPAGQLCGFAKVTRDATNRKRLQEQLEDQARLLDHVQDAVVATNQDLVVTAWNEGATRLYGWRAEEVLNRTTIDVLKTEYFHTTRDEALRILNGGGQWRGEVVQRHKSGQRLEVESTVIVMRHGPTRLVSVNRDIGERKQTLVAEERGRIARELHDSVSQALFSLTLHTRGLELALEGEGHDTNSALGVRIADIRRLTQAALTEMRVLIFELRPDALAQEGLVAALRRHAAALEAKEGLIVNISAPSDDMSFERAIEENLYRVVQEALSNVVKHASARTVRVRLAWKEGGTGPIEVEITDDGIGFDTGARRRGHLGLTTMSERTAGLGATLEVTSVPGRGTTIRATFPRNAHAAPA
jgi:PAS domain S-box-containing protein